MNVQRWIRRSASYGAVLIGGVASVAAAQSLIIGQPRVLSRTDAGMELFEWRGDVDREVEVIMRGNNVWTNSVGQTERPRARTRTYSRLPREDGQVVIETRDGRGRVDVIQQPSRQNNYTTIVRILDPRSGSDEYRVSAYWRSYSNGDVYGRGNGRGNGRDDGRDVYRPKDRDRDDDRDDDRDRRDRGGYDRASRELLRWSGNVDGEIELRIQNGRIDYRTLSGNQPTNIRANPGNDFGRAMGSVAVAQSQGRGTVWVAQQPSQWNGYTTVVRIRDPQGGYGYYDFSLVRQ